MHLFRGLFTAAIVATFSWGYAQPAPASVNLFQSSASGVRSSELRINAAAVDHLRADSASVALGAVPLITGDTADFVLTPMPIFTADAVIEIIGDNGTTSTMPVPDIRTWYGLDPNNPSRAMFVSADAKGEVRVMVTGDQATSVTVISQESAGSETYTIDPYILPTGDFCNTVEPVQTGIAETPVDGTNSRAVPSNVLYEIEMMVDIGNSLYKHLGSDQTRVVDHITNLFGAVSAIYQRDMNARFKLNHVFIWSKQDPFSVWGNQRPSSGIQLDNYRNYIYENRGQVDRDLAHFIDNYNLGGVAYLDVLSPYTRPFRCGVSNGPGNAIPSNISTYTYDTFVVAHEIGHNVGSHHTHCYNPPIDCCSSNPEDTTNDCGLCQEEKQVDGTIMSYCNNRTMVFHPRCIELMRPKIERSLLLTPYEDKPKIDVRGVEGIMASGFEPGAATTLKSPAQGGPPIVQTFTINNTGSLNLNLSGNPMVTITGSPLLTLVSQPGASVIAPGQSTTFQIQYNPQSTADQFAEVRIVSNDPNTPDYRFLISGRLIRSSAPYVATFNGAVPIAELGPGFTVIPVQVEGVPGPISDVNVLFTGNNCSVAEGTGLQHPWVGDLEIRVYSPRGTSVTLMNRAGTTTDTIGATPGGAGGANLCNTLFDDNDTKPLIQEITTAGAPYSGTYQPAEPLAKLNGEESNGTWYLYFYDWARPDKGFVRSFSLILRGEMGFAAPRSNADNWTLYD